MSRFWFAIFLIMMLYAIYQGIARHDPVWFAMAVGPALLAVSAAIDIYRGE